MVHVKSVNDWVPSEPEDLRTVKNGHELSTAHGLTTIIRESGERTFELCRKLLESEVGSDRIFVVRERPFARALKRTFEIGLETGSTWVLACDADLLIREGAVAHLLRLAEVVDENVFQIYGKRLDKFAGGMRDGGLRLYRTAAFERTLEILQSLGSAVRPEGETTRQMMRAGYILLNIDLVISMHDFEQYYHDIYRKAFLHARKSQKDMLYWERLWDKLAEKDLDYRVAIEGANAGRKYEGSVICDTEFFAKLPISECLERLGLKEKEELALDRWSTQNVSEVITSHFAEAEYWAWLSQSRTPTAVDFGIWRRFCKRHAKKGFMRAFVWLIGCFFSRMGRTLKNFGDPC